MNKKVSEPKLSDFHDKCVERIVVGNFDVTIKFKDETELEISFSPVDEQMTINALIKQKYQLY